MELKFNKIVKNGEGLLIDTNNNDLFIRIIEKSYNNSNKERYALSLIDGENKIFFNTNGLTKSELLHEAFVLSGFIESINFHLKRGVDITYFG